MKTNTNYWSQTTGSWAQIYEYAMGVRTLIHGHIRKNDSCFWKLGAIIFIVMKFPVCGDVKSTCIMADQGMLFA